MGRSEFRASDRALSILLSPEGKGLLDELAALQADEGSLLWLTTRLRRRYPPDLVAAALDLTILRQKAISKFARAGEMFFTRQALEQASGEIVSHYRAQRFASYPLVSDLCCGIGGDALGLAQHAHVLAVDIDPTRLRMAMANACVHGVDDRLQPLCADVRTLRLSHAPPFWADPSRRVDGKRVFSLERYRPPLSTLLERAGMTRGAGIKLSPGVDYQELGGLMGDAPYEVEIISVRGEAREAVLWIGELTTTGRRATLLPGEHTLTERLLPEPVSVTAPGDYLYEPDAAVIRAHLVEQLAQALGATKIDDQIAYLTSDRLTRTPFATPYRVDEAMPFQLKRLNQRLRTLDIGELIIKKRGFAVDPEQFRRRLKYGGGRHKIVLVLTHVLGRPAALLCRPC